jgi:predicted metal-dependent hydrolase
MTTKKTLQKIFIYFKTLDPYVNLKDRGIYIGSETDHRLQQVTFIKTKDSGFIHYITEGDAEDLLAVLQESYTRKVSTELKEHNKEVEKLLKLTEQARNRISQIEEKQEKIKKEIQELDCVQDITTDKRDES